MLINNEKSTLDSFGTTLVYFGYMEGQYSSGYFQALEAIFVRSRYQTEKLDRLKRLILEPTHKPQIRTVELRSKLLFFYIQVGMKTSSLIHQALK